ncbi:hypothetical protein NPIL_349031 [Nephila pilipes]|uniref:Uncharacterized protein n=1 Tax=Nephila pilipes TaxID=299642 RepID=A0A8X6I803_NEPPI|nr:hypothetical protein NPIL_349031 [Nephila pilipes]
MDSSEGNLIDELKLFSPLQLDQLHISRIASISSGKSHTVILDELGELYSMGSNRFGQLGWGRPGLDYNLPQKIEILKDVKVSQVSCGDCFTMVVTCDQELYCWGKCPSSLINKEEDVCDMRKPNCLKGKRVQFVSCYGESCIAVVEN